MPASVDTSHRVYELQAGGLEDPDGVRTAAVLDAYFHAEHMRAFRQILWKRLAALGSAWFVLGTLTSLFSRVTVVGGLALFAGVAIGAAVAEWRASEHLNELLRVHAAIVQSQPSSV